MNAKYFKKQIEEELDGADEYSQLALKYKATNPEWSRTFLDMSNVELGHAENLYSMWNEYCDMYYPNNSCIDDWKMSITEMYNDRVSDVKSMYAFYGKVGANSSVKG